MEYLWLKALHVAAVVTWVGGTLAVAVTIAGIRSNVAEEAVGRFVVLKAVQRWDRHVTSPAMLLAWVLGLTLAYQGSWFTAAWWMAKLAFVLLLSALHGALSGTLRRLVHADGSAPTAILRYAPAAIVVVVLAIAVLAFTKPF